MQYDGKEISIIDLDSANGTFIKGERIQRATLAVGDEVTLGRSILRLESTSVEEGSDLTVIDSSSDLAATLSTATFSTRLQDTQTPRLVVRTPERTWEFLLTGDKATIGRHPDCQICIPGPKISRHHAVIEAQEDNFIVRDLGSANGTWFGQQSIREHRLQDNDSIKIGDTLLIYKKGFSQDDLTLIEDRGQKELPPRRSVVFVPGLMGSELWLGEERVWPNISYLFSHQDIFRFPDGAPLEARGIVNEVVIVPNLIKQEQYGRLGDFLVEVLGYTRQVDLLEFGYDWRQDVRRSAQQLAVAIEASTLTLPITLIAHSLGTLVSRYYVECLDGKVKVERLILLGGPHLGVPKAVTSMLTGEGLLPFGLMGDKMKKLLVTFPSMYQILPTYVCAHDQNGQPINIFKDTTWLPTTYHTLLSQAGEFRHELGMHSSVPTISVFGYGIKTISHLSIQRGLVGNWFKLALECKPTGDETIPELSAILPGTEIHPVQQNHGSLYVDNDVKMRLKLELTRSALPTQ